MVQKNSIDMEIYTYENTMTNFHIDTVFLIGLASAAIGGGKVASYIYKNQKNSIFVKQSSIISGLVASLVFGYLGYSISKRIKKQ